LQATVISGWYYLLEETLGRRKHIIVPGPDEQKTVSGAEEFSTAGNIPSTYCPI